MLSVHDIPGDHIQTVPTIAHAAATATEAIGYWVAPFAAKVTLKFIPGAAVTGQATNYTNLNAINRGQGGGGTTEVGNIDFANGQNGVAATKQTLQATAFTVAAGDVIEFQAEKVGTGLALPIGAVEVTYRGA